MDLYEKAFGNRASDTLANMAGKLAGRYTQPDLEKLEVLDIGCGTMVLSEQLVESIKNHIPHPITINLTGWDISKTGIDGAKAKGLQAEVVDITKPIEEPEKKFDVVCFFEVLEHIVDTDIAIKNIFSLMTEDGLLLLSTPNLASWYNRLFLMLGLQPHCMELSFENPRLGNWVTKRLIPSPNGTAAGHLRLFTWNGLKDFLNHHHFQVLATKGISNHKWDFPSKLISLLLPKFSGNILVLAKKQPA